MVKFQKSEEKPASKPKTLKIKVATLGKPSRKKVAPKKAAKPAKKSVSKSKTRKPAKKSAKNKASNVVSIAKARAAKVAKVASKSKPAAKSTLPPRGEGTSYLLMARELGNSLIVVIPKALREKLEIEPGNHLKVDMEDNRLLVEKVS